MWSDLMDKTVSVSRDAVTKDAGGGNLRSWSTVASGIKASIQSAGSREVYDYARRGLEITHAIYAVYDFDGEIGGLKLGDRVVDAGGKIYAVQGVRANQNDLISTEPIYEIHCKRLV